MDKQTLKQAGVWLGLAVAGLIIFYGFSYWVKHGGMKQTDFNLTVKAENKVPDRWDAALSVLSLAGSFEITTLVLGLVLVWRKEWQGLLVFGMYSLGLGVELFGKSFLPHPSPPFMFYRYHIAFLFPSSYVHTNFSYPSGHAFRSTFIILFLTWLIWKSDKLDKRLKAIFWTGLWVFLAAMLFSRISLGEHWTSDVIGGVVAGLSLGLGAIGASVAGKTLKLKFSEVKLKERPEGKAGR